MEFRRERRKLEPSPSSLYGSSMTRHFHLAVETPLPNLVVGRKGLLGGYSAACRVAMGTYPVSKPGGGVTIKAGSRSASFPIVGGAR